MNNKLIVGFIVVILGVVAGWYLFGGKGGQGFLMKKSETQTTTSGVNETPVVTSEAPVEGMEKGGAATGTDVTYTNNGFVPNVLTVNVGTAVTFTNVSVRSMWVASALHPTHQILPGFDELASVAKGGTYTYTFAKVGTWKYHNHVGPSDTGTVIVTE